MGQLAALGEIDEGPRMPTVPEHPDDVRRTALDEIVSHRALEMGQVRLVDARDPREGRHHVDQAGVAVDEAAGGDAGAGDQERRP